MPEIQCTHFDQIEVSPPAAADVDGCQECIKIGGRWVDLRVCLSCGEVGCCDSSPNQHASKHAAAESHPIIRSLEPGEDWCWCFKDEVTFALDFN